MRIVRVARYRPDFGAVVQAWRVLQGGLTLPLIQGRLGRVLAEAD
jgi:hypothetical protein